MSNYSMFEAEVLSRSKKTRFDGNIPFVGLKSPDSSLNEAYLSILFNSLIHKILSYHQKRCLTYAEYERVYEAVTETRKKQGVWSYFYQDKLVLEIEWSVKEGIKYAILIPYDKDIIEEDGKFLREYRK